MKALLARFDAVPSPWKWSAAKKAIASFLEGVTVVLHLRTAPWGLPSPNPASDCTPMTALSWKSVHDMAPTYVNADCTPVMI